MKLTVDANVVGKWFVTEQLSDNARLLLTPRIQLHAPDMLLIDCANTLWKKFHTNEIPDPQPYFAELANLPDIVTLHSGADLLNRAASTAAELDHPVYDCLYLACSEATGSVLVTADQRFAQAAARRNVDVWHLGAPSVREKILASATAPLISPEKVEELIKAYSVVATTKQPAVNESPTTSDSATVRQAVDQDVLCDSPAYRRVLTLLDDLDVDERADMLALGWLDAGHLNGNWPGNLRQAIAIVGTVNTHFLTRYGRHWRNGYERLKELALLNRA